jgi:adenosylcobinamide-GDP ribazoletransferase
VSRVARLRDGVLLSAGTLSVLPTPAPRTVDREVAGIAMVLAPLTVLPLALGSGAVALVADRLGLPPLVTALLVVGTLALGTRALHWDGLADTVDGLTASYDAERALRVMRTGDVGPAGTVAVVVVAGLQAAALSSVVGHDHGWLAVVLLVCASRGALALACARGVPPARREGLGAIHAGSVPPAAVALALAVVTAASAGATALLGSPYPGAAGALAAVAVTLAVVHRCVRRIGGVTGDVLGAAVELSFTALLVAASAA